MRRTGSAGHCGSTPTSTYGSYATSSTGLEVTAGRCDLQSGERIFDHVASYCVTTYPVASAACCAHSRRLKIYIVSALIMLYSCFMQDRTIGRVIWQIGGNVPVANFIRLPQSHASSLGLTGRFLYLQVRQCNLFDRLQHDNSGLYRLACSVPIMHLLQSRL